jgi:hypothetical protein
VIEPVEDDEREERGQGDPLLGEQEALPRRPDERQVPGPQLRQHVHEHVGDGDASGQGDPATPCPDAGRLATRIQPRPRDVDQRQRQCDDERFGSIPRVLGARLRGSEVQHQAAEGGHPEGGDQRRDGQRQAPPGL